jgi:hypothetical protein
MMKEAANTSEIREPVDIVGVSIALLLWLPPASP